MTVPLSDVKTTFLGVLGKHSHCGHRVSVMKARADSLFHYLSHYSMNNESHI